MNSSSPILSSATSPSMRIMDATSTTSLSQARETRPRIQWCCGSMVRC